MCLISDTSLREQVFREGEFEFARKLFERGDWDSIDGRILIYPFDAKNLGLFSYDLTVGNEAYMVAPRQKVSIEDEKEVIIKPDDVSLILTQEFIGLPKIYAGFVMPRFCFVREGVMQSMTKIDPTWFGKIVVAIINHSRKQIKIKKGKAFCSLVIQKLDKPCSRNLNPHDTPSLGKESIEYFLKIKKTQRCLR